MIRRSCVLALLSCIASVPALASNGVAQRGGGAVDRGARRAGGAIERGARRTGSALERAAGWTGDRLRRAGNRVFGR